MMFKKAIQKMLYGENYVRITSSIGEKGEGVVELIVADRAHLTASDEGKDIRVVLGGLLTEVSLDQLKAFVATCVRSVAYG
ncbi:MAG: hypothetical protein NTU72_00655 [Fimbriimonadales bacterium]|nr:hypothetical protein [Fimbriimonadales bacterium]